VIGGYLVERPVKIIKRLRDRCADARSDAMTRQKRLRHRLRELTAWRREKAVETRRSGDLGDIAQRACGAVKRAA
jgi:hypothetical protein